MYLKAFYMLFTGLCMSVSAFGQVQHKFVINGHLTGLKDSMRIILSYTTGSERIVDSAITSDGGFRISGYISGSVKAMMEMKPMIPDTSAMTYEKYLKRDIQELYLFNGTGTIYGKNIKTALITGGSAQDDFNRLTSLSKPFDNRVAALYTELFAFEKAKDSVSVKKVSGELSAPQASKDSVERQFILNYGNSLVSFDLVKRRAIIIVPASFEPLYDALSTAWKNTKDGKLMADKLSIAKRLELGKPAIAFTQNDVSGKPVSLSSLRGKYVLIDFWASWCGPCRAEYPFLHKAYDQFKDEDFEIMGVSLDDKRNLWIGSIKQNNFPWIQVCDLKGYQNEVALAYGINAIPQNFLIDPQGKIVAANLRGEDLIEKLRELIKPR